MIAHQMVKALLIEDDRKLSELLREFLGQHGVEAVVAQVCPDPQRYHWLPAVS